MNLVLSFIMCACRVSDSAAEAGIVELPPWPSSARTFL
jgi:hypothetical protein